MIDSVTYAISLHDSTYDSILEAVLTVSPKSWNRDLSPRRTPAVTGPECKPIRIRKSAVSAPNELTSLFVTSLILIMHSFAKRAMITA